MAYRGDTGDPYVDPESGVLKNLAGIKDADLLEAFEGEMSIIRQIELSEIPPPPIFDYAYPKAIHRHLFQDVYRWAGQPRTVDMAKGESVSRGQWSCPAFLRQPTGRRTRLRGALGGNDRLRNGRRAHRFFPGRQ